MPVYSTTQKILDAVQAQIITAIGTASGASYVVADANIVDAKLPWVTADDQLPGVILTPVVEIEKPGTNASDDVGYGVQVTIAQTSNRSQTSNADRLYFWRETIAASFRRKRLAAVPAVYTCVVEPKPVIDPAAFGSLFDATAFVLRFWARHQR